MKPRITLIKDLMYNLHPNSGSSDDYCNGIVVGCVSGLMYFGLDFSTALSLVAKCYPENGRNESLCVPESWLEDFRKARKA